MFQTHVTLSATAVIAMVTAGAALAVPADPARPLAMQTCAEAMTRLAEARVPSPLVSAEDQAVILQIAEADATRLCAPTPRHRPDMPTHIEQ